MAEKIVNKNKTLDKVLKLEQVLLLALATSDNELPLTHHLLHLVVQHITGTNYDAEVRRYLDTVSFNSDFVKNVYCYKKSE